MTWVKLDDTFPEHPKVVTAGGDAAWLHVCALAYCNRHPRLAGIVPREMLSRLSDRKNPTALAAKLVSVGLWDDDPNGWRIHDYHEFQPTAEKIEELRRKRAEAGRKGGQASKGASKSEANCLPGAYDASKANRNPDPTRPVTYSSTDTNLSQSVPDGGGSVDNRRDEVLARYGLIAADKRNAKNPNAYAATAAKRISTDPEVDRLIAMFPTAPADAIAAWLHGDRGSMRYYPRADELAPVIELKEKQA